MNDELLRIDFYPARLSDTAIERVEFMASELRSHAPRLFGWMLETLSAERWRRSTEVDEDALPVEPYRPLMPLDQWTADDIGRALCILSGTAPSFCDDEAAQGFWCVCRSKLMEWVGISLRNGLPIGSTEAVTTGGYGGQEFLTKRA